MAKGKVLHIGPHLSRKRGVDRGIAPWRRIQKIQVGLGRYRRTTGEEVRWFEILKRISDIAEERPEWAWYLIIRLGLVIHRPVSAHALYDAVRHYCSYAMDKKREWEEMKGEL